MRILDTHFHEEAKEIYETDIGTIYAFDSFIISEFDFGIDINFENYYEVSLIIQNHFKDQPFGFIANRVNSYSINLTDAELFNEAFKNCKAHAVVLYNSFAEQVLNVENKFFNFNSKSFTDLNEAVGWVEETLLLND